MGYQLLALQRIVVIVHFLEVTKLDHLLEDTVTEHRVANCVQMHGVSEEQLGNLTNVDVVHVFLNGNVGEACFSVNLFGGEVFAGAEVIVAPIRLHCFFHISAVAVRAGGKTDDHVILLALASIQDLLLLLDQFIHVGIAAVLTDEDHAPVAVVGVATVGYDLRLFCQSNVAAVAVVAGEGVNDIGIVTGGDRTCRARSEGGGDRARYGNVVAAFVLARDGYGADGVARALTEDTETAVRRMLLTSSAGQEKL